jgi:4-diphosphocytidyl-2-C-methyl-D-erythritol kinase
MTSLTDVPAPAKLNLFLHVTGRRPDGYHLLQSVFMLVDWCDTLHFELRRDGGISREDLSIELPDDDLVVRSARALQQRTGTTLGAHIAVEKKIPAQAGMGGGSSDAASCLLALNRLWGLGLPASTLADIGLSLGADVPFFLSGGAAWVEGIGEQITPIDVPAARFCVLKPTEGLETAKIFASPLLKRNSETATISGFAANPFGFGHNDLQPVAEQLCPAISEALAWLSQQGLDGRMTGSGSAVFAVLPSGVPAPASLPSPPWQARICSNLEAHPLKGWAS